jgi:DNA-binding CsgD family transcriptional regulator
VTKSLKKEFGLAALLELFPDSLSKKIMPLIALGYDVINMAKAVDAPVKNVSAQKNRIYGELDIKNDEEFLALYYGLVSKKNLALLKNNKNLEPKHLQFLLRFLEGEDWNQILSFENFYETPKIKKAIQTALNAQKPWEIFYRVHVLSDVTQPLPNNQEAPKEDNTELQDFLGNAQNSRCDVSAIYRLSEKHYDIFNGIIQGLNTEQICRLAKTNSSNIGKLKKEIQKRLGLEGVEERYFLAYYYGKPSEERLEQLRQEKQLEVFDIVVMRGVLEGKSATTMSIELKKGLSTITGRLEDLLKRLDLKSNNDFFTLVHANKGTNGLLPNAEILENHI